MPIQLLQTVCADYQANLERQSGRTRALSDAVQRYQRGDTNQINAMVRELQALRELRDSSADLAFAADTAVTTLIDSQRD
jgi:hypothetical protein